MTNTVVKTDAASEPTGFATETTIAETIPTRGIAHVHRINSDARIQADASRVAGFATETTTAEIVRMKKAAATVRTFLLLGLVEHLL